MMPSRGAAAAMGETVREPRRAYPKPPPTLPNGTAAQRWSAGDD